MLNSNLLGFFIFYIQHTFHFASCPPPTVDWDEGESWRRIMGFLMSGLNAICALILLSVKITIAGDVSLRGTCAKMYVSRHGLWMFGDSLAEGRKGSKWPRLVQCRTTFSTTTWSTQAHPVTEISETLQLAKECSIRVPSSIVDIVDLHKSNHTRAHFEKLSGTVLENYSV